jgi:hypothetical protein
MKKIADEELHNFYLPQNITSVIKSHMIGKACSIHGIMRNSYKSMLRKPDGQRQF